MTQGARWLVWLIVIAEIPLNVFLYLHYRNVVDGQPELANVAAIVYGVFAIIAIRLIDRVARRVRRS